MNRVLEQFTNVYVQMAAGRHASAPKNAVQKNRERRAIGVPIALPFAVLGTLLCWGLHAPGQQLGQQTAAVSDPCDGFVAAQGNSGMQTVGVESGPQPGKTDPMGVPAGRYSLYPIQGLGAVAPTQGKLETLFYQPDSKLNLGNSTVLQSNPWDPNGWGPTPIFATSGRILSPDHDDFVFATRSGNPSASGLLNIDFLDQGHSTTLVSTLPARQAQSTDFIAIAQGDLDMVADDNGNLHHEVVVAYLTADTSGGTGNFVYRVDVLNYNSGKVDSPDITSLNFVGAAPIFNYSPIGNVSGLLPSENIVSVSIGDFDGDGNNEIAVTALGNQTLLLYTFRYQTDANSQHTLTQVSAKHWNLESINPNGNQGEMKIVGTIASAAGDFDGDGADELAIGYAKWGMPKGINYGQYAMGVLVLKYDKNLNPSIVNDKTTNLIGGISDKNFAYSTRPIVQLVSAQFLFNPPSILYGRRQFAVAWNDTGSLPGTDNGPANVKFQIFKASNDLQTITGLGPHEYGLTSDFKSSASLREYSVAAGGFNGGATDGTPPAASFAVSLWAGNPLAFSEDVISQFEVYTFAVGTSGTTGGFLKVSGKQYPVNSGLAVDYRARMPLVAYDRAGQSFYLGAPLRITVLNAPRTDFVMQEPPKHAYWDEEGEQVVNLTRFDRNNVHLYNSSTSSFLDETINTEDWTIGGSAYLTAKFTFDAPLLFESTSKVAGAVNYDYNKYSEENNSQYRERTIGSQASTDRDDFLIGALQTYDIWRYRVYGTPQGEPLNYFYEIVLPGPEVPFSGGGLNFDWYQPIHENGNILSYPATLGSGSNRRIPFDIGTFTLPNGTEKSEPLVPPQISYFDGIGESFSLDFSSDITVGNSVTTNNTLGENLSAEIAVKTESREGCGSVEFHNSNSWGKVETTVDITKTQTAVTLNKAPGRSNIAYPFYPVVYNTANGTLKMAFSMPNPASQKSNSSGFQTYANLYGGLPDPALNLPLRFQPVFAGTGELEKWSANLSTDRKQMRGLFFRATEKDPVNGTYNFLSANPKNGDQVRIEPRIYNYSTAQPAFDIAVEYQVIPYKSDTNSEICATPINSAPGKLTGLLCPASARTVVGKTTVPQLNPQQFTCIDGPDDPAALGCAPSAFINWDTTGFGPPNGGTMEYRVYVVLNPGRSGGAEIYPAEPPPVAITHVTNGSPVIITAPGNGFYNGDYVTIAGVQSRSGVNGIFTITPISADDFELNVCEPAPPCSQLPPVGLHFASGESTFSSGGTATLLDPGQNNEGYGLIAITTPPPTALDAGTSPLDYLAENSLEALNEAGLDVLQANQVTAQLGIPLQLRFTAYSTAVHPYESHVLLYDGDPAQGNSAIADKFIHPGENGPDGASIWMNWTPATTGNHQLYAVLVAGADAAAPAAQLNVNVTSNPNPLYGKRRR